MEQHYQVAFDSVAVQQPGGRCDMRCHVLQDAAAPSGYPSTVFRGFWLIRHRLLLGRSIRSVP